MGINISNVLINLLEDEMKEKSGPMFVDYTPLVVLSEPTPVEFILSTNQDDVVKGNISIPENELQKIYEKEELEFFTFKIESDSGTNIYKISYKELVDPETGSPTLVKDKAYNIITDGKEMADSSVDSGEKIDPNNPNPTIPSEIKTNRNEIFRLLLKNYGGYDGKEVYGDGFYDKEQAKEYSKLQSAVKKGNKDKSELQKFRDSSNRDKFSMMIAGLRKSFPTTFFNKLNKAFPEFNLSYSKSVEESFDFLVEEKNPDKYKRWKIVFGNSIGNETIDELDKNIRGFMAAVKKWFSVPTTYKGKTQSYKISFDGDKVNDYWKKFYGNKQESYKPKLGLSNVISEIVLNEEKGKKQIIFKNFKISESAVDGSMNGLASNTGINNDGKLEKDADGRFITSADLTLDDFKETAFYLYGKDAGKFFPRLSLKFKDIPKLFGLLGRGGLDKNLKNREERLGLNSYDLDKFTTSGMSRRGMENLPKYTLKFDKPVTFNDRKSGTFIKIAKDEELIFNWDKKDKLLRHRTSSKKYTNAAEIQIEMPEQPKEGKSYTNLKIIKIIPSRGSTFVLEPNFSVEFTVDSSTNKTKK